MVFTLFAADHSLNLTISEAKTCKERHHRRSSFLLFIVVISKQVCSRIFIRVSFQIFFYSAQALTSAPSLFVADEDCKGLCFPLCCAGMQKVRH